MHIGIIGLGMVGSAVRHGFSKIGHNVKGYDIKEPETSIKDVLGTELCFICVPTPTLENGICDISAVRTALDELVGAHYQGLAVIKSTVPPGTTDQFSRTHGKLRLAFCPEFLREKAAYTDFVEHHDLCVIGAYDESSYELIKTAHEPLPDHFAWLTPTEAELTKYFSNVFNALRVIFANEFYEVSKVLGADYRKIKNAMVHRRTIADAYMDCSEHFRGYGGACLPKDAQAFATFVAQLGINMKLFECIVEENKKFKTTVL